MARTPRTKKPKLDALEGVTDPRAPLDSASLLAAARPLLAKLEADLRARAAASPSVTRALEERHAAERKAERTADSFAAWSSALATQVAAAWLLSCVFVRTLEDRGLLRQARLAGPGAMDSQRLFFQLAPSLNERDYLLTVFRELATHPAAKDLFDAEHSLVWKLSPSAELAKELLALFRTPNADAPAFRFGQASTRFLGDLYQDLSEDVRKRYALLQTPDFVEAFILDRTLEPAIERFGLDDTTVIDPTCGSGHFLLGSFNRLFDHRLRAEPGLDRRVAATRALDAVFGADLNPYAVAIARFRLTLSYLDKAGYAKLADAPALPLHLVVADSLRINPQHDEPELWKQAGVDTHRWLGSAFALEDEAAARDVLFRQYAAVVGNPPYITEKDPAKREVYRRMYVSAAGKYALSAPFCERFFQLARPRGYVGQITANSFMKREFGTKLIEEYLPTINLELIVNTSGAYIPGHGTPTVLLFGTREPPLDKGVLAVLAKRGEPSTPEDPAKGLVWSSVVDHWQHLGFEDDYLSIASVDRAALAKHPWSLGGGGTSELKELLEDRARERLVDVAAAVGVMIVPGTDDVYVQEPGFFRRMGIAQEGSRPLVLGEGIRDWSCETQEILYAHDASGAYLPVPTAERFLWRYRSALRGSIFFGKTKEQRGLNWRALAAVLKDKLSRKETIAFAEVATHNHFVLDRDGKVFKQTAPVIKLPADATEDEHLALLGYLNSSTACFWMKQVAQAKASHTEERPEKFLPGMVRFQFSASSLAPIPLPPRETWNELAAIAREAERTVVERNTWSAVAFVVANSLDLVRIEEFEHQWNTCLLRLIAIQEDLDWAVYGAFGLVHPEIGNRIMGNWCLRHEQRLFHGSAEMPELPGPAIERWRARTAEYRRNEHVRLLEGAEYKRRWDGGRGSFGQKSRTFREQVIEHLQTTCLDRIELNTKEAAVRRRQQMEQDVRSYVTQHLSWLDADKAGHLVRDGVESTAVPFVAAHYFSESGLTRRADWEDCWSLQRKEDSGDAPAAPLPPRYEQSDFLAKEFFDLRGKLDVPKERFISYPGCESDEDGEPVYGWAGWNHPQRAQALASLYLTRKDGEGWAKERLTPMLAGLLELIPWIQQWHNEPSAQFDGLRMGDYFAQFLDAECRQHGLSHDDLRAWRPTKKSARKPKPSKVAADEDAAPKPARKARKKKDAVEVEEA